MSESSVVVVERTITLWGSSAGGFLVKDLDKFAQLCKQADIAEVALYTPKNSSARLEAGKQTRLGGER